MNRTDIIGPDYKLTAKLEYWQPFRRVEGCVIIFFLGCEFLDVLEDVLDIWEFANAD